jgi:uncharacterized protein (DUF4415 family)
MQKKVEFSFESARRITPDEVKAAQIAIKEQFGIDVTNRGRPPKEQAKKYQPVSIRLHPQVIAWAKEEAKKRGVGYQTVINDELLKIAT